MTMNNMSSKDIRFSYNGKRPFKKVHQIANRTFIVIDETLVEFLSINENNTWLKQQAIEDGILMRIHRFDTCLDKERTIPKKGRR
jgi:hypothetical protein